MVLNQRGAADEHGDRKQSAAGTADENGIQDNHHSAEQVITLKETLSQRDNEISILRNKNKQKQTNPGTNR